MPELSLDSTRKDFENSIYLYSVMHFPGEPKKAREYCARARLEIFKHFAAETSSETLRPHYMSTLARDIDLVLNSSYAKGHDEFLKMSTVRRKRGLWAGSVLFQLLAKMHKDGEKSVKNARINAFEWLEQQKNIEWRPDHKKDFGSKDWKEFKPVSHLWAATIRIIDHIDELRGNLGKEDDTVTTHVVIRDYFREILSLAQWMFSELEPDFPRKMIFFDPDHTWFVPKDYPLPPIKEVFTPLPYKK